MFQQLPTAGLPYPFTEWAQYESYVADMMTAGIVEDHSEVRWDVRPSPQWGTIEMRACDGLATAEEIGAVAALIQCLVEYMSGQIDRGEPVADLQPWFVRENKWRSARYGLDADIIVNAEGEQQPVRDAIRETVSLLMPTAHRLGCAAELAHVELILQKGASYQRQLIVAEANGGSLRAVVSSLSHELRHGLS